MSFHFGDPPQLVSTTPGTVKHCYETRKIEIRPAKVGWTDQSSSGDVNVEHKYSAKGLAFYIAGKRRNADEVLEILADPSIIDSYAPEYERAERRGFSRKVAGWILAAVSTVGVGAGTGFVIAGVFEEPRNKQMMWGGATAIILGLIAAIPGGHLLRSGYRYSKVAKAYRTIFISSKDAERLSRSIEHHNRQVLRKCRQKFNSVDDSETAE